MKINVLTNIKNRLTQVELTFILLKITQMMGCIYDNSYSEIKKWDECAQSRLLWDVCRIDDDRGEYYFVCSVPSDRWGTDNITNIFRRLGGSSPW